VGRVGQKLAARNMSSEDVIVGCTGDNDFSAMIAVIVFSVIILLVCFCCCGICYARKRYPDSAIARRASSMLGLGATEREQLAKSLDVDDPDDPPKNFRSEGVEGAGDIES
jgi:hypothetical protein